MASNGETGAEAERRLREMFHAVVKYRICIKRPGGSDWHARAKLAGSLKAPFSNLFSSFVGIDESKTVLARTYTSSLEEKVRTLIEFP
jgi:hypothetical protein